MVLSEEEELKELRNLKKKMVLIDSRSLEEGSTQEEMMNK